MPIPLSWSHGALLRDLVLITISCAMIRWGGHANHNVRHPGAHWVPRKEMWRASELTDRFSLAETPEKHAKADALLLRCRTTFVTGLVFDCFRRATDKTDLRNRLAKAVASFEKVWDKKYLHPTVLARFELAWRFAVPV